MAENANITSMDKNMAIAEKVTDMPNLPALNPNADNSCYLDAVFELLFFTVLPNISTFTCENPTSCDELLLSMWKNAQQNLDSVSDSSRFRQFAWNDMRNIFQPNKFDDPANVLHAFFDKPPANLANTKLSPDLRKHFVFSGISVQECFHWTANGPVGHDLTTLKDYEGPALLYLTKSICDEYDLFDVDDACLGQGLTEKIISEPQTLEVDIKCEGFGISRGSLKRANYIHEVPEFFFVRDPLLSSMENSLSEDTLVAYPSETIVSGQIYAICGRIRSTSTSGQHFYTDCIIDRQGQQGIYRIDNMNLHVQLLSQGSIRSMQKQLAGKKKLTTIVCYAKTQKPRFFSKIEK